MVYGITGASGQLGQLAADRLLEHVDPTEVVLLSRNPTALASYADRGVAVRPCDFSDPGQLVRSLSGVDRLLLVSIDVLGERRIELQHNAIDAAQSAGVGHVLYTSLPQPTVDNPAHVAADHRATEEHLQASGMGWTMLRNNIYADFQIGSIQQGAQTGTFITNHGDGRAAFVTRADCAAAAAGALMGDHSNTIIDVTGPDAVSAQDMALLAQSISERPVSVDNVDDATFEKMLIDAGIPRWSAVLLTSFGRSIRENFANDVTTAVRDLSGAEPTPLSALV